MKKVLAIFMAIAMVATMFSFSVVSFAEGEEAPVEKVASIFYIGGTIARKNQVKPHNENSKGRMPEDSYAISYKCLDVNNSAQSEAILPVFEEEIESGLYTAIELRIYADSPNALRFVGLKGSEETPIVITYDKKDPTAPLIQSKEAVPAITVEDCENVVIDGIAAKSPISNGIVVKNSKNITLKSVSLNNIGYTDYTFPVSTDTETGVETFPKMETEDILLKGTAILIGEGNENVTVDSCKFDSCRAGVVVDASTPEVKTEGDEAETVAEDTTAPVPATGVEILNCTFEKINEAAVIVNGAEDVVVSGGSATKVGDLANADDYDFTTVAVVKLADAKNATVEKIFSSYNECFIDSSFSTGRIRYNVSDNDKGTWVVAETAADMLVYNNTFVGATSLFIDATAKNNIFAMLTAGEKVEVTEGEANCYYWTSKGDRKSIKKNPAFANAYDGSIEGTTVRDNYILSSKSPCLGAGVQVEDDMGATDFYGNAIGASHNIGADEGAGAEATTEIVNAFIDFFNYLFALIRNFLGIK